MPSGAKKRKAAKKKQQNQTHFNTKPSHSNSLGTDNDKANVERESSEEPVLSSQSDVAKGENANENVGVQANAEVDFVRETKNGNHKRSSSSSSSGTSEDGEVVVEKEKPVIVDEQQVPSSVSVETRENPVITEVVDSSVEESIPVEETVKNVLSLPHESNAENESEGAENPVVSSYVVESEMKDKLDAGVPSADGKDNASPVQGNFLEEKTEAKVIQVVYEGFVDMKPRDGEGLFPQSSGVSSNDASCGDNPVKESEIHKHAEEKALISSTPMPVQRTSWTNCCGLFEVFSGGAGR